MFCHFIYQHVNLAMFCTYLLSIPSIFHCMSICCVNLYYSEVVSNVDK
jgi:hypothetical protein